MADDDLDYMHARYYKPSWGRFLSTDPRLSLARATKSPQSWNRYSYAISNPLMFLDRDGRDYAVYYDPEGAGGLGHVGLYFQDEDRMWNYYDMGPANMEENLLTIIAGQDVEALVDLGRIESPRSKVRAELPTIPGASWVRVKTTERQDALIAFRARLSARRHNVDKTRKYNLYRHNSTDAVFWVLDGISADVPIPDSDDYVFPGSWFRALEVLQLEGPPAPQSAPNQNSVSPVQGKP